MLCSHWRLTAPPRVQALLRALLPKGADDLHFVEKDTAAKKTEGEEQPDKPLIAEFADRVRWGRLAARRPSGPSGRTTIRRACVVAAQVLQEADQDADGYLNFEEFAHAVAHSDIRAKLTIVF